MIRLKHHAAQRGPLSNSSVPWLLKARGAYVGTSSHGDEWGAQSRLLPIVSIFAEVVDLIPEYPSDWIPFDPDVTSRPKPRGFNINLDYTYGFNRLRMHAYKREQGYS
jgi:hypothetical protein